MIQKSAVGISFREATRRQADGMVRHLGAVYLDGGGRRNMLYIVCYDIADERRRMRVAETLLDFGRRLEESVFAVNLDEELTMRMKARLQREIEETVPVFPLCGACGACAGKMEVMGRGEKPEDRPFYVI